MRMLAKIMALAVLYSAVFPENRATAYGFDLSTALFGRFLAVSIYNPQPLLHLPFKTPLNPAAASG